MAGDTQACGSLIQETRARRGGVRSDVSIWLGSAKGERKGFHTYIEKLNFKLPIRDGFLVVGSAGTYVLPSLSRCPVRPHQRRERPEAPVHRSRSEIVLRSLVLPVLLLFHRCKSADVCPE